MSRIQDMLSRSEMGCIRTFIQDGYEASSKEESPLQQRIDRAEHALFKMLEGKFLIWTKTNTNR